MKIYTRAGDSGETSLIGGQRVPKAHPRLDTYGVLDELNSLLGILLPHVSPQTDVKGILTNIQSDLFAMGAVLANPASSAKSGPLSEKLLIFTVEKMESDIDRLCTLSPELKSFVLPAGCPAAVHAHHARTVCRRAERSANALSAVVEVPPWVLAYLNRLGDWLFALARAENSAAGILEEAPRRGQN